MINYGVIGCDIGYSLSPKIHQFWMDFYGIKNKYHLLDVKSADLLPSIRKWQEGGLQGANVTIPFKETVLQLTTDLDVWAQRAQAVNTLKFQENGRVAGYNTDAHAFFDILTMQDHPQKCIIIGGGGAAKAVIAVLSHQHVPEIIVYRRQPSSQHTPFPGGARVVEKIGPVDPADLDGADFLVHATPVGRCGQLSPLADLSLLSPQTVVVDYVYLTTGQTPLIQQAQACGLQTMGGKDLLLAQARHSFYHWFGIFPTVDPCLDLP